jgi:hypothetical protein
MRLAISFARVQISYFSDLRIKSYGCLKIIGEVWVGQVCARANEEELTTFPKICRQDLGSEGTIKGDQGNSGQRLAITSGRPSICNFLNLKK